MTDEQVPRVDARALEEFCIRAFRELDVPAEDARITAHVLVTADLRGVDSHGVARLRRYVEGLRNGMMKPRAESHVVSQTPATALIDADAGLGQPASYRAMELAIEKARDVGTGFVTVRNSNHYGIAGYYAMMALEHDFIGLSMTNASVLVPPTFGRAAFLGTNPLAMAAPAGEEYPYVLDMATSTVPKGKLEVYDRLAKPLPAGWVSDEGGASITDAAQAIAGTARDVRTGMLLPLGGLGESLGGHKGYGLALLVEILCAVLSGASTSDRTYATTEEGDPLPADIGHFFGALRVGAFRPLEEFRAEMDALQRRLRAVPPTAGAERIYIHGEKEFVTAERRQQEGIPLNSKVVADLRAIAAELGMSYDL
jgi:LDH2 family malate/lactate/ureidoglycolate dehydrogenase